MEQARLSPELRNYRVGGLLHHIVNRQWPAWSFAVKAEWSSMMRSLASAYSEVTVRYHR